MNQQLHKSSTYLGIDRHDYRTLGLQERVQLSTRSELVRVDLRAGVKAGLPLFVVAIISLQTIKISDDENERLHTNEGYRPRQ